jgi:large subunit ribosomal protein L9
VATNQKVADRKIARQEEQLQSLADKISGQRLTFTANTGEQGRLYGSITAGDIADELSKAVGSEIDRRKVALEDPIRSVGEHTITVHLVGKLRPQVTIIVMSDKVDEPAEETETAETEDAPETEESPAEEA